MSEAEIKNPFSHRLCQDNKQEQKLWRSSLSVDFHGLKSGKFFPGLWMFRDLQLIAREHKQSQSLAEKLDFGRSLAPKHDKREQS